MKMKSFYFADSIEPTPTDCELTPSLLAGVAAAIVWTTLKRECADYVFHSLRLRTH